jgi:Domain of unknown function (DUF4280)
MGDEVEKVPSEEPKNTYVVAGAYLKCSCCDTYSVLTAPLSHGVYIKDKAQMNIMDFKPIANIKTFGMCKSIKNPSVAAATAISCGMQVLVPGLALIKLILGKDMGPVQPMPCQPVITKQWEDGKKDKLVENQPALLNISKNSCAYGGEITIVDDGQE